MFGQLTGSVRNLRAVVTGHNHHTVVARLVSPWIGHPDSCIDYSILSLDRLDSGIQGLAWLHTGRCLLPWQQDRHLYPSLIGRLTLTALQTVQQIDNGSLTRDVPVSVRGHTV